MEFKVEISEEDLITFHQELSCSDDKPSMFDNIQNLEGLLSNYFSDFRVDKGETNDN